MKIPVRDLTPDERSHLARLLFKAGFAVRPLKQRKTDKGQPLPYVEFWDGKEIKQDE